MMKMERKGLSRIRITHLYIVLTVLIAAAAIIVGVGSSRTISSINDMQISTDNYIEGQDAIDDMRFASNLLSEKARDFVVTGNIDEARDYSEETDYAKSREEALERMARSTDEKEITSMLKQAFEESSSLEEVECYAMKLAADAYGLENDTLPDKLAKTHIKASDAALSRDQKLEKSKNMMFGEEYDKKKEDIREDTIESLKKLIEETHSKQVVSYKRAAKYSSRERIMMVIILVAIIIMLAVTAYAIILPIKRSTKYVRNNEPIPLQGSEEYVSLVETYNKMLHETKLYHEELTYEATHDEITGLYNRKMYEVKREELVNDDIALLVIDVDDFKRINDNYGHDTGDMMLKKVAHILTSSFRGEDLVCRVGGDEFAVIMVNMEHGLEYIIEEKIKTVRGKMSRDEKGLPPATLSIGVAFNDEKGDADALFKKADIALYKTKKEGKDGYTIFSEGMM